MTAKKKKVLLIEDDRALIKAYQRKFKIEQNLEVDIALDGEEGLRKLHSFKPDLILLDLMMAGMDGFEFLTKVQKDKTVSKDLKILILSNLGQESDIARCRELGADHYLVKSNTSIADIYNTINKYLSK